MKQMVVTERTKWEGLSKQPATEVASRLLSRAEAEELYTSATGDPLPSTLKRSGDSINFRLPRTNDVIYLAWHGADTWEVRVAQYLVPMAGVIKEIDSLI